MTELKDMKQTPGSGGAAKNRIKNITKDVEAQSNERISILPETNWEERMAMAREKAVAKSAAQPARPKPQPTTRPLSEEFKDYKAHAANKASKNVQKKKSVGVAPKLAAAIVVLAILAVCFLMIRKSVAAAGNNGDGLRLYNNAEYEQAVTAFEKALSYDDENADIYINLGMTYVQMQRYDDALAAFDQAVICAADDEDLQMAKRGAGIVYSHKGHYTMAIEQFEDALSYVGEEYTETELDILYYLAEAQSRTGDSVSAIKSYTEIIDANDDANAYMLRGLIYYDIGDYEKTESDLETAIRMNKKNYKTYLTYYDVLMAQGKTEEARQILLNAVDLGGKNGEDYANRGMIYVYMQDYENAVSAFRTAIDKDYLEAYIGLADAYVSQGDVAQGAACYEEFIATGKATATAYNQYGLCLMDMERYAEAADAFAKGLELNDRLVDAKLMFNEAVAYEQMRDWATAYEKMKAFVDKYPENEAGQHELIFLETRQ